MAGVTTTELAEQMGVTKGRVSQWVAAGKLDGCYKGEGRNRRFDLKAAAEALGRRLDSGQMMGNGAQTRQALRAFSAPEREPAAPPPAGDLLNGADPQRYELARTQKVEEEARRLRRDNQLAEGSLLLATEAARQVRQQIAGEIAQVETMLRAAARRMADEMGVDYREVRAVLTDEWRRHRGDRSEALANAAAVAEPTEAERDADF
jgi:excisionase family DNA binding protein